MEEGRGPIKMYIYNYVEIMEHNCNLKLIVYGLPNSTSFDIILKQTSLLEQKRKKKCMGWFYLFIEDFE